MITFLLILLFSSLAYAIGMIHCELIQNDESEFWASWYNPLLYFIIVVGIVYTLYKDGWKDGWAGVKEGLKELAEDINNN